MLTLLVPWGDYTTVWRGKGICPSRKLTEYRVVASHVLITLPNCHSILTAVVG